MKFLLVGLGLHIFVLICNAKPSARDEGDGLWREDANSNVNERTKRESATDNVKITRQIPEGSTAYLTAIQQIAAERDQSPQAQQQVLQQLIFDKDSSKLPAPSRYFLSQDGRLLEESAAFLTQSPQQFVPVTADITQFRQQAQSQIQAQQQQTDQRGVSPELTEFSRQQQHLQQQYADTPIRAQIASGAARASPRPVQQTPGGRSQQSPQVFIQTQHPTLRGVPGIRTSIQDENPNFVYATVPVDAQTILQQQLAQLSAAGEAEGRHLFPQSSRPLQPQQVVYQQPSQQELSQQQGFYDQQGTFRTQRPVAVTSSPQPVPEQSLPQQYLIETTRPQIPQTAHFVAPQQVASNVRYEQPGQPISQSVTPSQVVTKQKQHFASTLLQPVPVVDKPSRSSIFVTRTSSTPRPHTLGVQTIKEHIGQRVPVVRLPSPTEQRPVSQHELQALINAGYSISSASVPESFPPNYLKSKRQQPIIGGSRNHVIYENHQDGVQYQYSPGSSFGN